MALDLYSRRSGSLQHLLHFRNGVCASYRSRRIVVCKVTSIKRQTRISQGEVNWVANEIVNHHCDAANTKTFVHKLQDLVRLQMMNEEATIH